MHQDTRPGLFKFAGSMPLAQQLPCDEGSAEHLVNKNRFSMCHPCDMDAPVHGVTRQKLLISLILGDTACAERF
jgi:hypothetical protein